MSTANMQLYITITLIKYNGFAEKFVNYITWKTQACTTLVSQVSVIYYKVILPYWYVLCIFVPYIYTIGSYIEFPATQPVGKNYMTCLL